MTNHHFCHWQTFCTDRCVTRLEVVDLWEIAVTAATFHKVHAVNRPFNSQLQIRCFSIYSVSHFSEPQILRQMTFILHKNKPNRYMTFTSGQCCWFLLFLHKHVHRASYTGCVYVRRTRRVWKAIVNRWLCISRLHVCLNYYSMCWSCQ